jgi:Na+:H+ antiporter, NhaA family
MAGDNFLVRLLSKIAGPTGSLEQARLTNTFRRFIESEKSAGMVLIFCTVLSLTLSNSPISASYLAIWQMPFAGLTLGLWINDLLMAIFFLLIGLELERELYSGELSNFRKALLPIFAAAGGIAVPALIHLGFNANSLTQPGIGIPMATDIAFALAVLAILGSRVPASLKVFVVAYAVIDDLSAIMVIAVFYTAKVQLYFLLAALAVWLGLVILNRFFRVMSLIPYLLGGLIVWALMLKSGVHATIAGVLLAFAIPYSHKADDQDSPSHRLENVLHKPVAFIILPLFALANTALIIGPGWMSELASLNSLGIILGLVIGKPLGIALLSFVAVRLGICKLPQDLSWRHIVGAGMIGGIGFTMSIFITNLAFVGQPVLIDASKVAVLVASLLAGFCGFVWLRWVAPVRPE